MENPIAASYAGLANQADKALGGINKHGVALNLSRVTAVSLGADADGFTTADLNYKRGKSERATKASEFATLLRDARVFSFAARDVLKRYLGMEWSALWDEAGFFQSLEVPRKVEKMIQLQLDLKNYFTAHNTQENEALNVKAARAAGFYNDIKSTQTALITKRGEVRGLQDIRKAKAEQLRVSLRTLLKELAVALPPKDARWIDFGFNIPGVQERPETPENLTVVLIGPNAASVKWAAAARAEHYRVWKKVQNVDENFIAVGNPADLDFTLEGLPGNATIEVAVSAVNDGGESAKSAAVTVTTV